MVLCKFFLEGRCRFGDNCRNEHTSGRPTNSFQQQPFNQRQQYFQQPQQQQRVGDGRNPETNLDSLLYVVKEDATNSVQGGQWLLSCYAPQLRKFAKISYNKNEENLPGLMDYSPEELHWEAISSNMTGQFHDYTIKLQQLAQSYHAILGALQNLDPQTANFIVRYERGENVSPSGTALGNSTSLLPTNITTVPSQPSQFSFTLPSAHPQQPTSAPFRFQIPAQQQSATAPFNFQLPAQQQQPAAAATFRFQMPAQQQQPIAAPFSFQMPAQQLQPKPSSMGIEHNAPIIISSPENDTHALLSQSAIEQFKAEKFLFGKIPRIPPPKEFR